MVTTKLNSVHHHGSSFQASAPAAVKATQAPPLPTARPDQVSASTVNPYEGFAEQTRSVKVDGWKKGPNDSVEKILRNQGYSLEEIYRQDSSGLSPIDRVAQANGLKDPNLVRTGKVLVVPSKHKEEVHSKHPQESKKGAELLMSHNAHKSPAIITPAQNQPRQFHTFTPKKGGELMMSRDNGNSSPAPEVKAHEPKLSHPTRPQTTPVAAEKPAAAPVLDNKIAEAVKQGDSIEVGMLIDGVKKEQFTRTEFQALNSTANQFTELRARAAKDGFTMKETQQLAQIQQQYGQMYARFAADDKARISFKGGDHKSPTAQFHAAQNEEGGRLYDEFKGSHNEKALKEALLAQRETASERGLTYTEPPKKHSWLYRVFHHKAHKEN